MEWFTSNGLHGNVRFLFYDMILIYSKPSEKVMHLTLVAVRKRLQGFGIGKYLLTVSVSVLTFITKIV